MCYFNTVRRMSRLTSFMINRGLKLQLIINVCQNRDSTATSKNVDYD